MPAMTRLLLTALMLGLLLPPQVIQAEKLSPAAQRMLDDVATLASDEYEGRGIGTAGLKKAGEYIANAFREAGLTVTVAGGDPYQEFDITDGARLVEPNTLAFSGPDGKTLDLKYDEQFRTCAFGGSGTFDAQIVFAGYGIDAEDAGYSDYENIDVKGKVVIVMRRNPQQANPHGQFAVGHGISRHAALTTKLSQAFTRGAVAVLFVNDPYTGRSEHESLAAQRREAEEEIIALAETIAAEDAKPAEHLDKLRATLRHRKELSELLDQHQTDPLMEFGYGGTRSGKSIPCFHVSQAVCNQLLKPTLGKTLSEIEQQIDETGKPFSRSLTGWTAQGEAHVEAIQVPARNVVGVLEGDGPHKDETIVIGAHFDHLGMGGEGSLAPTEHAIHNGADDNASGTAGLIELARRLAGRDKPLPRRIVFIAFNGEERGLLGSEEYVKEPLYPLDETVAMFNMDMIGRLEKDKLIVFGTGTSSTWDQLIKKAANDEHLEIASKPEGFGPSDHSTFYAKRIPVLHLFTGTHSDYHRPSDDTDKINAPGMERIIDFLEEIIVATATAETRPDYQHVQGAATLVRSGSRPYFGSIPNFGTTASGYAIQGVSPDSPAEKAGLKGGDVIIKLGDHKIGGLDDFDLALRDYGPGEQVSVVVLRDGEEKSFQVTLATPRG